MGYRDFQDEEREDGLLEGALGGVLDESIDDDEDEPKSGVDAEEEKEWE
ncbi:MAG: hypothetical protein AAB830_01585 [Patescibacteria group bacterium]